VKGGEENVQSFSRHNREDSFARPCGKTHLVIFKAEVAGSSSFSFLFRSRESMAICGGMVCFKGRFLDRHDKVPLLVRELF
jgi:hypothetical protein